MHAFALFLCITACQLKEAPYLPIEFQFSRPIKDETYELEKLRMALVLALKEHRWKEAVKLSDQVFALYESGRKEDTTYMRLQQAELLLVAGEPTRALKIVKPLLEPLGTIQGKLIRTSAELYAMRQVLEKQATIHERQILANSNSWAHNRWRGLRFVVDLYLAKADLRSALQFQEEHFRDFQATEPLEFDGGTGQLEMDSYLLPLRAAVRGELRELEDLANFGYKTNTKQDPAFKFIYDVKEQKRLVAAISSVVLARYHESKGAHAKALDAFKRALRIMELKPVVVNREILLWFLVKERISRATLTR